MSKLTPGLSSEEEELAQKFGFSSSEIQEAAVLLSGYCSIIKKIEECEKIATELNDNTLSLIFLTLQGCLLCGDGSHLLSLAKTCRNSIAPAALESKKKMDQKIAEKLAADNITP